MSWIKRNLYFLAGGVVAVVLLGLAGYYCYSKWELNNRNLADLEKAYEELRTLTTQKPNPGNEVTNNIDIAQQQTVKVRAAIRKERQYFVPIPPIPNPTNHTVTKEEFASSLRRTLDELQRAAENAGVSLPPNYNFSFQAQRNLTVFPEGSLPPLSTQLGEVKTICNVLFKAKVNSLDNLRRERVSSDDLTGPQTDYLDSAQISQTNELAVLTPYEVSFHCFSSELASVLAGFANEPRGFVVRGINVEPAGAVTATGTPPGMWPGAPGYRPSGLPEENPYGVPAVAPMPAPTVRGGLITVLDEKQVRVRLVLEIVKLLPEQS